MKRASLRKWLFGGGIAVLAMLTALVIPATAFGKAAPQSSQKHTHPVYYFAKGHYGKFSGNHQIAPAVQGSGNLAYGGGPVQHTPVTYVIFWGSGWSGSAPATIIQNYFHDMAATTFENILTQYYDNSAHISDVETVGGVYFDTSTPTTDTSCGGSTVEDSSLQTEVNKAIGANGWPRDGSNAVYYVYTPSGYYINDGTGSCNAPAGNWCAYHNWSSSQGVAYGAMPYPGSGCTVSTSPNGNTAGDSEVNLTSHEQFEAITDPQAGNGWLDSSGYEIGDKCAWDFSQGLTTLGSHQYEVQTEYSNASSSCVNSYGTVSSAPTISGFSPTSGPVGTSVTITGTNFTGASSVKFNGTSASYTVNSSTQITATVPSGATTGPISVTTSAGTATSSGTFTVTTSGGGAPTISSFSPTSGAVGTSVTISGTNFTGATAVKFNGTSASYTVNSSTQITATVPSGATTGPISVTNSSGTGTSSSSFTVTSGGNTAQLIKNGGFESGQSPWSESSANGYQLIDPTNPHTGSYSAWLCGYNNCSDAIWQTVTIPSTMTKSTLSFWLYIDTQESGSTCYDYFYARIRTSGGTTITTPLKQCNANAHGWVQYTYDVTSALSGYKGQNVQVYFLGTTDSSLVTDMFVDDVTFTVNY